MSVRDILFIVSGTTLIGVWKARELPLVTLFDVWLKIFCTQPKSVYVNERLMDFGISS